MGYSHMYAPQVPAAAEGMIVKVKDPAVKGNVLYDVPLSKISQTQGLKEYLDSRGRDSDGTDRKSHIHRSCICKLWLDGRCGQGGKCKSFHVDPTLVQQMRAQRNVEFDDSFLSELVVRHASGAVFAVRYTAVCKTKGLEMYKAEKRFTVPATLCPDFNPVSGREGLCIHDRGCKLIHVKATELKELAEGRQRTPCCIHHGDEATPAYPSRHPLYLSGRLIPADRVAPSAALHRLRAGQALSADHICSIHVKSRCKFGRSCVKLHVCRKWMADPDGEEAKHPDPSLSVDCAALHASLCMRVAPLTAETCSPFSTPHRTPVGSAAQTPKVRPLMMPDVTAVPQLVTAGSWSSTAGSGTPSPGYRTTSERSVDEGLPHVVQFNRAAHALSQRVRELEWTRDAQLGLSQQLTPDQLQYVQPAAWPTPLVLQQAVPNIMQQHPRAAPAEFSLAPPVLQAHTPTKDSVQVVAPMLTPTPSDWGARCSIAESIDSSVLDLDLARVFTQDLEKAAEWAAPSPATSHDESVRVEAGDALQEPVAAEDDEGRAATLWGELTRGDADDVDTTNLPPLIQDDAVGWRGGAEAEAFDIPTWDPDTNLASTPLT